MIAVDCDDVIANLNGAVRLFVNETFGHNHTAEDYRVTGEYKRYWSRIWGTPEGEKSEYLTRFTELGQARNLEPLPGALETLRALKQDFRLALVTARSEADVEATHYWLEKHAPDIFDHVTFMHLWDKGDDKATKAAICLELGAQYLIDDNYDHCQLAAEAGIGALLFGDYGWNRAQELTPGMVRVLDWRAVKDYFDERAA